MGERGVKMGEERAEAMRLGKMFYFTGVPCKRGHIAERNTSNGSCRQCRAEWHSKNETPSVRGPYKRRGSVAASADTIPPPPSFAELLSAWGLPLVPLKIDLPAHVHILWTLPDPEAA